MMDKDIEIISGDTMNLKFKVTGNSGPVDLSRPGTILHAQISDLSGRKVVARFQIIPIDMALGEFQAFLDSRQSNSLRGKYLWAVRYEYDIHTRTLAGGTLTAKAGA